MINRLNNQRCYLAGAIDRVSDKGRGWREQITPFLKSLGVVVFNPILKPTEIGLEDNDTHLVKAKLKSQKRYDELSSMMKVIRSVDLRLIDISDFIVVNLDLETHPCGTQVRVGVQQFLSLQSITLQIQPLCSVALRKSKYTHRTLSLPICTTG